MCVLCVCASVVYDTCVRIAFVPPGTTPNNTSLMPQVRTKCLTTIAKIVVHAPPAVLTVLLHDVPASSFIAGLLASDEPPTVCAALHLSSVLLAKLPDVFATHFVKEGVVHALRQLAAKQGRASDRGARRRRTRSCRGEGPDDAQEADGANTAATAVEAEHDPRFPYLPKGTWPAAWDTARLLLEAHFGGDAGDVPLETDGIRALRGLCDALDTPETWSELCALLAGQGDVRVSTFEFLNSGALKRVVDYLQGIAWGVWRVWLCCRCCAAVGVCWAIVRTHNSNHCDVQVPTSRAPTQIPRACNACTLLRLRCCLPAAASTHPPCRWCAPCRHASRRSSRCQCPTQRQPCRCRASFAPRASPASAVRV